MKSWLITGVPRLKLRAEIQPLANACFDNAVADELHVVMTPLEAASALAVLTRYCGYAVPTHAMIADPPELPHGTGPPPPSR